MTRATRNVVTASSALFAVITTTVFASDARASDPMPNGSIQLFNLDACPAGWQLYQEGAGRLMLPRTAGGKNAISVGDALADLENRKHSHTSVTASFTAERKDFCAGSADWTELGREKTYTSKASTVTAASSNLPYIQYLSCRKVTPADGLLTDVPQGLLTFFDKPDCPSDFADAGLNGVFPLAAPRHGNLDKLVGGPPINEATGLDNTHTHPVDNKGAFVLVHDKVVAVAAGCKNNYARGAEYPIKGASSANSVNMPFIVLQQCRKS